MKIGFGLKSDRTDLKTNFNITARKLLDLAVHLRGKIKKDTVGARSAVAAILGTNLQKSHKQTTSNWANRQLTPAQINYAANDSLSALLVFLALKPEDQANLLRDL